MPVCVGGRDGLTLFTDESLPDSEWARGSEEPITRRDEHV